MAKPKSLNAAISEKAMNLLDTMSPSAAQKAMKSDFNSYKQKTGSFHKFDERHAMNTETTTKKPKRLLAVVTGQNICCRNIKKESFFLKFGAIKN